MNTLNPRPNRDPFLRVSSHNSRMSTSARSGICTFVSTPKTRIRTSRAPTKTQKLGALGHLDRSRDPPATAQPATSSTTALTSSARCSEPSSRSRCSPSRSMKCLAGRLLRVDPSQNALNDEIHDDRQRDGRDARMRSDPVGWRPRLVGVAAMVIKAMWLIQHSGILHETEKPQC